MLLARPIMIALVAFALTLTARSLRADDLVDNPQYQAWARFAVGSSQISEGTIESDGMKIVMGLTRTFTEKTDENVTLQISMTMNIMGQKQSPPPQTIKIPAKADPKDITEIGTEEVTAAGKTFSCKIY